MTRRVAILCEFPTLNGGERSLLSLLPRFAQAGWEPIVLCPPTGALADALHALGVAREAMEVRAPGSRTSARTAIRESLSRQLRRLAPALVHANSVSMGRLAGPVVVEGRIPSLAHLRDIVALSRAAATDLNRHQRLLAVSHATRAAHLRHGVDGARTHVLYNGVNLRVFRPGPRDGWLPAELGRTPDTLLVGCIGQIILRKGQDTLAAAAELLAEEFPRLHWAFVGARHSEKPETLRFEAALRGRFAAGPLQGRGHFLGTRTDVPRILRELTLLAHPARQEPLGRVLLEAGASGCPVVATDVGGTREIFPDDQAAAALVPPDDPAALAAALKSLLGDPARRLALALRARRRIESAFDARQAADGLLRHYNEVADR